MKVRFTTALFLAIAASGSASAVEISESTLNSALSLTFPRDIKGFHVANPKLELKDGNANFCAIAQPKLFPKNMYFCTTLVPQWHQETGSLHASNMVLTNFVMDGVTEKKAESAKTTLNQLLLPLLDGMQIYQTKSWIGKRVSAVTVQPGKVSLGF